MKLIFALVFLYVCLLLFEADGKSITASDANHILSRSKRKVDEAFGKVRAYLHKITLSNMYFNV